MRRHSALIAFSLLCFAGAALGQQTAPPEVLTLDAAIQQALENNRILKIATLEILKSSDTIGAARTRRLPHTSFNILGSHLLNEIQFRVKQGQFGTFPATGPIPDKDTFITTPRRFNAFVVGQVTQPLSQLYSVNLNIRQAEFNREVNRQKLRAQQQKVINNVKKVYFAALDTEGSLKATEEMLTYYRELDHLVDNYVLEKVALKSDSMDVKAQVAKLEYDALTQRNQLTAYKEQLNVLMGRDLRTDFTLSPVAEPTALETDLPAAQNRALLQRPDVLEARLQVKQAEQDRRIKKAEYIPDISLSFNYLSPFQIEFLPKNIATIGVQFSWEPFDWGRRKHELEEKSRAIEQARQQQFETEQNVLLEVNDKYRKLGEARALVNVAEKSRDSAREKVRVAQVRYREKAVLLKDVLDAQANLETANYRYQQAVLAFWRAKADFELAIGEGQ